MNNYPIATILGGGGFIGRYLVRNLTKKNYRCIIPTRNPFSKVYLKTQAPTGAIELIKFSNVQGMLYGEIDFIYDHLGLLIGEVWRSLPDQNIVRRFAYTIDMLTGKKEIWEYDDRGQEVSYIVLSQPPASQLYKTVPPRYGNRLDEISIILEDIRTSNLKIPFDVFIPKTDHDLMLLTNGDSLMIEVIDLGKQRVTFKIIGNSDQLTMPIYRVKSITSKYGERIFP